jgi:LysR family transcriptional regulator, glycine cleavage system transcriptional activator
MAQRLPPLNGLRTFIAAARSCSFTQAAEELYVTPAAVSRSIRSLEDHLGCTLFHRLHREVALTKEGQFYFESLGDIFNKIADAT